MSTKPDLTKLRTEQPNPASTELDRLSALEIARVMNLEDGKVTAAVERALPEIARAIEVVAEALRHGGRLIYVGAGTSGRIAALDAAECAPTFDISPRMVQFVMAGGEKALGTALEADEDSRELGVRDVMRKRPAKNDVVVGIAASGRTPYTVAAVEYARSKGAKTIAVVCNADSPLEKAAHLGIVVDVGPEVLTGSTRLKAGTAEKMVLNMISTGAMARLGYVYGNLMVNVHTKNQKLMQRGLTIIEKGAGVDRETARRALQASDMNVPVALVMLKAGVTSTEARRRLKRTGGHVRRAIDHVE